MAKNVDIIEPADTHCWGRLVFLQPLPTIHSSHQSLEQMHWFEAIFKMFARAVFEAIEVKGGRMVKEGDFEAEKIQIIRKNSDIQLSFYVL